MFQPDPIYTRAFVHTEQNTRREKDSGGTRYTNVAPNETDRLRARYREASTACKGGDLRWDACVLSWLHTGEWNVRFLWPEKNRPSIKASRKTH